VSPPHENDPRHEEESAQGWLCSCGAWNDHDFHCDDCGAEPPWGCGCFVCDGEDDDDDDCCDDLGEDDDWLDDPY
jgi:hypothetical protein